MALQEWSLPRLSELLPLDASELEQVISYTNSLPEAEAAEHLRNLLGDSPQALQFITEFNQHRKEPDRSMSKQDMDQKTTYAPPPYPPPDQAAPATNGGAPGYPATASMPADAKFPHGGSNGAPPTSSSRDEAPPGYAPPPGPPPGMNTASLTVGHNHTNIVIEAEKVRARDEVSIVLPSEFGAV